MILQFYINFDILLLLLISNSKLQFAKEFLF